MTTDSDAARQPRSIRSLAALLLLAAVATAAVSWMDRRTRTAIARNEQAQTLKILTTVLPADSYDNQPANDVVLLADSALLGSAGPQPAYTARARGQVVANVLTVTAPGGYVGPISLLVGIRPDGRITGVRAIEHQETPGLGDRIDANKDNWIEGFRGRGLDTGTGGLALRRDGGDVDHISGATITSRAVTNAVANALRFHAENRELLAPAPTAAERAPPGPAAGD